MPNVENLVMDEELERVIDIVLELKKVVGGFWNRRVFGKALRRYSKLYSRVRNLNSLVSRYNYEEENQTNYDPDGKILSRIYEGKRALLKEAEGIRIGLRGKISGRKMESDYNPGFAGKIIQYEEETVPLHKYLEQEALGSRFMPASGMVRVLKSRSKRDYE